MAKTTKAHQYVCCTCPARFTAPTAREALTLFLAHYDAEHQEVPF